MCIGFIGLGNMGCALANIIASNGYNIIGWEHNKDVVKEINSRHSNSIYLPGVKLNSRLKATTEINDVMQSSEIIFIAIPSVFIRQTLSSFGSEIKKDILIVNVAKGIEPDTGLTACQVLSSIFPNNRILMLSGPSIANEFARGKPTVVIIAGKNRKDLLSISKIVDCNSFRVRFSMDVIGTELGGILKNIYAIGLGMFDGLGIKSVNFRAAYLTIALEEMILIGTALGGEERTFFYFAGLGDLLATSLSQDSHNRRMGELLAKGLTAEEIKNQMGVLPEGYNTLKNILYISEKLHVNIPLSINLWKVINSKLSVEKFVYSFIKEFIEDIS